MEKDKESKEFDKNILIKIQKKSLHKKMFFSTDSLSLFPELTNHLENKFDPIFTGIQGEIWER